MPGLKVAKCCLYEKQSMLKKKRGGGTSKEKKKKKGGQHRVLSTRTCTCDTNQILEKDIHNSVIHLRPKSE